MITGLLNLIGDQYDCDVTVSVNLRCRLYSKLSSEINYTYNLHLIYTLTTFRN